MSLNENLMIFRKKIYHSKLLNPFNRNPFADRAIKQTVDDLKGWHILLRRFIAYPLIHPVLPLKIGKKVVVDRKVRLNPFKSYIFAAGHFFPEEIAANLSVIHKHTYTLIGTEDQVRNNGDMGAMWLLGLLFVDKLERHTKGARHDSELRMQKVLKYGGSVKIYLAGVLNNTENQLCGEPYSSAYNLAKNCQQWYCTLLGKLFGNYKWFKNFSSKYGKVEIIPIAAHTSNNSDIIRVMYDKAVDKDGIPIDVANMSREDFFEWFKDTISSFSEEMMDKEHSEINAERIASVDDLNDYNSLLEQRTLLMQEVINAEETLELIKLSKSSEDEIRTLEEKLKHKRLCLEYNREAIENSLKIQKKPTIGGTFGNIDKNIVASLPFVDPDTGECVHSNVVLRATLGEDPRHEFLKEIADKYYDDNDWTPNDESIWDVELTGHQSRACECSYRLINGVTTKITGDAYKDILRQESLHYINWWEDPNVLPPADANDDPEYKSYLSEINGSNGNQNCQIDEDPWSFLDRLNCDSMNNEKFILLAPETAKRRVRTRKENKYDQDALKRTILDMHKE